MVNDQNLLALITCVFKTTITDSFFMPPFYLPVQMPLTQTFRPLTTK